MNVVLRWKDTMHFVSFQRLLVVQTPREQHFCEHFVTDRGRTRLPQTDRKTTENKPSQCHAGKGVSGCEKQEPQGGADSTQGEKTNTNSANVADLSFCSGGRRTQILYYNLSSNTTV